MGRASSVCFSNSKRQVISPTAAPGSSNKRRKRRPRKGKKQGGKKPGMPADKQPANKQPPPPKACKCTECDANFTSHNARKKHFNTTHKPESMEVETPRKRKRKAVNLEISTDTKKIARKNILANREITNESDVKDEIRRIGNAPGNYRINFRNNTRYIDINDYQPENGSFGLGGRRYSTTIKPPTGLINNLLEDNCLMELGDPEFYTKYQNILKKDD